MKKLGLGLLGTAIATMVAILVILPLGAANNSTPSAAGKISVQFAYVDLDGTNCYPITPTCKICPDSLTSVGTAGGGGGAPAGVLCVDYLTATGSAKLAWSASFSLNTAAGFQKSGTIYPGQRLLFTFVQTQGPGGTCPNGDNPCPGVTIHGPTNSVTISYYWD